MKIVILDGYCINPGDLSWECLTQFGQLQVFDRTDPKETIERATGAAIVLASKTLLPDSVLSHLPDLKYIGVIGTGYNNVDVDGAKRRNILVTNVPTYGTDSVAQMVFALVLELSNRVQLHADAVRAGEWQKSIDWTFWKKPLMELSGKTIGIVGFGRIGRKTAEIASAFGMHVLANDPDHNQAPSLPNSRWLSFQDLLSEADVVSLHTPLLPETRGLMNCKTIARMKRNALLINTSRGPLVVDQDLADALNTDRIGGAGLDVLSVEPPSADNPLLSAKNCIVTPHIAWATREARGRLVDGAIGNLKGFLQGRPQNVV